MTVRALRLPLVLGADALGGFANIAASAEVLGPVSPPVESAGIDAFIEMLRDRMLETQSRMRERETALSRGSQPRR